MITEVRKGGQMSRIGIRPGDIIRKVNGAITNAPEELKAALIRAWGRRSATFFIQRGRVIYTVPIQF